MIEHFKGEEVFVKKVLEFKDQALYKQRLVLTKFLNPYHQSIVYSIVGNQNDLIVIEDGGMVDSEMKRLIIAPSFYQIEKEDFEIVLAKISYAKPFGTLNHRDILGALMSLGVKRELFGDIYEYEDNFYVAMDAKIYEYVKNKLMFEQQEKVLVLCLNSRLEVIKEKTVFIGSNNISIISSRELFKEALICGSSRIVIIHNHPSGNPEPSVEDIEATKKIFSIAKKLDIEVVDHLIIGRNKFYSFQINKVIEV